MGKILIIKNADFSQVAIEQVTPVEPTDWVDLTDLVVYSPDSYQFLHYPKSGNPTLVNAAQYSDKISNRNLFIVDISDFVGGIIEITNISFSVATNYDPPAYWNAFASDILYSPTLLNGDTVVNYANIVEYIDGTRGIDEPESLVTQTINIPNMTKYLLGTKYNSYPLTIRCKRD